MTTTTASEDGVRTAQAAPAGIALSGAGAAVARLLPSFTDVAFLVPIASLLLGMKGIGALLGDGDTGWHLRAGEWILQNGRVPSQDLFSYTRAGQPWFAWEWLWEASFAWLHAHWGMAAVLCASTLVFALTFALVYRLSLWRSGHPVLAIVATLVASFGSSIHLLARPHLFTLLLVVVFYTLLERVETGNTRLLLWLPGLTIVWANLHGGFLAGIVIVAMYAAGHAISWAVERQPEARAEALRRAGLYGLCAVGCLLASLANPYGYQLHQHILHYMTNSFLTQNIVEFFSMNFQHPVGKYVEAMVALGAITAAWNIYHRRFTHALLLCAWMHMGLYSVRHIPVYLIIAAPLVSECVAELAALLSRANVSGWLQRAAQNLLDLGAETAVLERIRRIPVIPVAAAVVLFALLRAGTGPRFLAEYDAAKYPVQVAETLRGETGLLTTDVWGGYLIYRLYPEIKTFIDGRSDFYGTEFCRQYTGIMQGRHDWQKTLDRYPVRSVLLPVEASLVSTLKESARWRPVYDDGKAILFRRVEPARAMPAGAPESTQVSAVHGSGLTAIARSQTHQPVIRGSHTTRGDN